MRYFFDKYRDYSALFQSFQYKIQNTFISAYFFSRQKNVKKKSPAGDKLPEIVSSRVTRTAEI